MILGLRQITRQRFGAPVYADGYATRPAALEATVRASVDVAPQAKWALDADGNRTIRVVELVSWEDFRAVAADDPDIAIDGAYYADRVIIDGRTYEVQAVTRMEPCEGIPRTHYETRATEVRGVDEGVA